ncbi:DUF1232 domain-containing protein [Brevibacillus ginsengisoli]|uniref:DUF1232 domain-containing protein n=1 Tax=Brevibacillus ginsengisoli TaxID=363854 RepID=UPI003CF6A189
MSVNEKDSNLGLLVKSLLKERSLSMRKMSELTRIDTATISRIVNGKQQAKPDHIQRIAYCLGVPTETLFKAAGYDITGKREKEQADIYATIDTIQEVLESSNFFDRRFTTERVQQELTKYEKYALTVEGQRLIVENFPGKVEQVSGTGPFIEQLKDMYVLFCKDSITTEARALLGSALLYFILSTDIIPDYIFPIGYLDDAIAVQLVLNRLAQIEPVQTDEGIV